MKSIKICGITNRNDAINAIQFGASAIGFIFYKNSPRYITKHNAYSIIKSIKEDIIKVGVFVNETKSNIEMIANDISLDVLQLHGNESPEFCDNINFPIIKALHIKNSIDKEKINKYNVDAFLFDTYKKNLFGGSGESFSWGMIEKININKPIILSGGVNIKNIKDAVSIKNISAVDINSGIEKSPGIKDKNKMKNLMNLIKDTNNNNIFTSIKNYDV